MRRPVLVRVLALCAVASLAAACSSDGGSSADGASTTTVAPGQTGGPDTVPLVTLAPTTTFMPDCATMPAAAAITAAVGVPMSDGQVVGSGTCQFLGLNDQTKSVTLGLYTDPGDQATFNDLQKSLGAVKPYKDKALPGAKVGADSTLFLTANGSIYTVLTTATDQPAAAQVKLSAAVMKAWLPL